MVIVGQVPVFVVAVVVRRRADVVVQRIKGPCWARRRVVVIRMGQVPVSLVLVLPLGSVDVNGVGLGPVLVLPLGAVADQLRRQELLR
jgi:hypothetical protein